MTQSRKTLVSFLLSVAFLVGGAMALKYFFGETDVEGLDGGIVIGEESADAEASEQDVRRRTGALSEKGNAAVDDGAAVNDGSRGATTKKSTLSVHGKIMVPSGVKLSEAKVTIEKRGDGDGARAGDMVAVLRSIFSHEPPAGGAFPDAEGRYVIGDLAAGRYTVTATAPGCVPKFVRDVVLHERMPDRSVDFSLEQGSVVRGTVRSPEGTPIKDATVRFIIQMSTERDSPDYERVTATTNADGEYVIVAPSAAHTLISCSAEGYAGFFKDDLEPVDGRIDIVLARGARIEGRVVAAETNEGIGGAVVYCVYEAQRSGECMVEAKTRGDGSFVLAHVDATGKSLAFVVEAAGWALSGSTAEGTKQRGPTLLWRKEVPDGQTASVDFKMVRLADAVGKVIDFDAAGPLGQVVVELHTSGKFNFGTSTSVSSHATTGEFKLVGVPPGTSTVGARLDGYFLVDESGKSIESLKIHQGTESPKDAGAQAIDGRNLEIFMRRGRPVAGRVVGADGKPVFGAEIKILRKELDPMQRGAAKDASSAAVFSNEDGSFRFPGLRHEALTLVAMHADFFVPGIARIVAGKDEVRGIEIVVSKGSTIEGEVRERGGAGIPEIVVIAKVVGAEGKSEALARALNQTTRTDAAGRFRFDGLLTGEKVEIVARDPRKMLTEVAKTAPIESLETAVHIVIEMAKAVGIRGIVVDAEDRPIAGLMVSAYDVGRPDAAATGAVTTATTNASGEFTLVGLSPEMTVDLRVSGRQTKKRETDGRDIPVPVQGEAAKVAAGSEGVRIVVAEVLPK